MKLLLVFACLLAVSLAAPRPDQDNDNDNVAQESQQQTVFVSHPTVQQILQPVSYTANVPVGFTSKTHAAKIGAQSGVVFTSLGSTSSFASSASSNSNSGGDSDEQTDGTTTVQIVPVQAIQTVAHPAFATQYVAQGAVAQQAIRGQVVTHNVLQPAIATQYVAQGAVAKPISATQFVSHNVIQPAFAAQVVSHARTQPATAQFTVQSQPAISTQIVAHAQPAVAVSYAAPVQLRAQAVQTVQHAAVAAVPSAITYQSQHTVQLPNKEINVPVHSTSVHVPVEQRVHYGVQNFVTGTKTTVHKPKLSAPAIFAPQVFVAKKHYATPEVTLHHTEVVESKSSPNYVEARYDAGVIVEHAAPEYKQYNVPTPVDVPTPVHVPQPYAVAVPTPVKVKSSISPVVNVDVHTLKTHNVITPIEYQAHHHVASAPVVATHAAPAVATTGFGHVGQAVTYGAAVPSGQIITHGNAVPVGQVYSHGNAISSGQVYSTQGSSFPTGQAVAFTNTIPSGQTVYQAKAGPVTQFVASGSTVPLGQRSQTITYQTGAVEGAQLGQAFFQGLSVPGSQVVSHATGGVATPSVITYTGAQQGAQSNIVSGTQYSGFVSAPPAQINYKHQ